MIHNRLLRELIVAVEEKDVNYYVIMVTLVITKFKTKNKSTK